MKAKSCMMIAVAAGAACSAFASEPQLAVASQARHAGHVYVNVRTGERVFTPASTGTSRAGDGIFVNEDNAANGNFFWGIDNPTRTGTIQAFGSEGSDSGDIPFNTVVDGLVVGYATNAGLEIAPVSTLPGFTMINWFYDNDGGIGDLAGVPAFGLLLSSAPGAYFSSGFTGWTFTFDFAPDSIGELGDNDGTATGAFQINGPNQGVDKDDTDGNPKADFGWAYTFIQGQAESKGTTGPYLVLPYSADVLEDDELLTGAGGNADGVHDRFSYWATPTDPNTGDAHTGLYGGNFWFGGWPAAPYASFMIGIYGTAGGGGPDCGPADYNGDTNVDVLDFLDFLDDYGACDGFPTPCGSFGNPDMYNPDDFVDILDFLGFFDIFGQCS